MVQNAKSKKAKQAEKAPPVRNGHIDSEQSQTVQNIPSKNANKNETNTVPIVESEINGEQNNVAEPQTSSKGARSAVKSRAKKAAESAAENGEGKSAAPQSKTKGRPKKGKKMEIVTTDEAGGSGDTQVTENEVPSTENVTANKRKADSPVEESAEVVEPVAETESLDIVPPAKKSRKEAVTGEDKKKTEQETAENDEEPEQETAENDEEPEQETAENDEEPEQETVKITKQVKKSGRKAATAKTKKETVEQTDEMEQESAKSTVPEKRSRKRTIAEPVEKAETKSKKRDAKKSVPVIKSKKQKGLLSIPSVKSVSGKVFVIGENDVGQLGFDEDVEVKKRPAMLELPYSITAIAAGGMHSVCLTEGGEVITFGCNDEGALGRITTNGAEEASPGKVEIPEKVIQVSAGDSHTAALTESGQVYLWGNFRSGDGPMGLTADAAKQVKPIKILTNIQVVKISSGTEHLACLSNEGVVYTCGCGQNGQLGRLTERTCRDGGRKGLAALVEPGAVSVTNKKVLIEDVWACSYSTLLKAKESGRIYAFGLNNYNQLGYEKEQVTYIPKLVNSFSSKTWKEITGGQHHTISLDIEGLVYSLGRKDYGRLGLGEDCEEMSTPTLITSLESLKVSNISCGNCVSFAVGEEGSLYSWGMGTNHQLGHGNDDDCHTPRLVEGNFINSWKALKVSGGGQHTLVLATPKESASKE